MTDGLPMFPLGSVLIPHMLLPLRVFEPRYLTMIEDVRNSGDEFGVVLIERGFEVGGGESRFDVGTVARIIEVSELDGGHLLVLSAGQERIKVDEWLPDDPYPCARVTRLPDHAVDGDSSPQIERLRKDLRTSFGLMSELGYDIGAFESDIAADPIVAGYQGMTLAPLAMIDRQKLLELDDASVRLRRLLELIDGQVELFRRQLAAG